MSLKCEACGNPIPAARRKLLPGVKRCVGCSSEKPKTDRDVPVAESSDDVNEDRTDTN